MVRKQKSPYKNFSIEQIEKVEKDRYIIQVGQELFYEGKYCAFSGAKAEELYETIWASLEIMRKTGSDIEKEEAYSSACNFRVIPLRIQ